MNTKVVVYTARKVITMDPGRPVVEAIAVLNGRILATGSLESMQPWLSRYDVTIDDSLQDKVICPGFIESHAHCWMSAGLLSLNFIGPLPWPSPRGMNEPLRTFEEIVAHLHQAHASETDATKPIIAWGYDKAKQGGVFDRDLLDQISCERPIFVISWAPHFVYLNTPALKLAQVPEDLYDVHIHRYPDGRLNGVLSEALGVRMGLAPVFVGVASDLLQPRFGNAALEYALLAMCPITLWIILHCLLGARTLKADIQRAESTV